jgi:hypothetical protein
MSEAKKDIKAKKVVKKVDISFNEDSFKGNRIIEDRSGKEVEVFDFKKQFRTHLGKCKFRTCKKYDVSLEHMDKAVLALNGRLIDGFLFNHLIGRLGYFDGELKNRANLALEYKSSLITVELAEARLLEILQNVDVKKAYADYMEEHKKAKTKTIETHISVGGNLDE